MSSISVLSISMPLESNNLKFCAFLNLSFLTISSASSLNVMLLRIFIFAEFLWSALE